MNIKLRIIFNITVVVVLVASFLAPFNGSQVALAETTTLLSASFNSSTDGFAYQDDTFGTSQPSYASGTRTTTGGYSGSGGLQVSLGGVDANLINGMSGGWSYTLSLGSSQSGVSLSFRYKLEQTPNYEFRQEYV